MEGVVVSSVAAGGVVLVVVVVVGEVRCRQPANASACITKMSVATAVEENIERRIVEKTVIVLRGGECLTLGTKALEIGEE